jgi:hypothetical protein
VNTGDNVVYSAHVRVRLLDDRGFPQFSPRATHSCPSRLEPGQRGAWEIFDGPGQLLPNDPSNIIPRSTSADPGLRSDGLTVRLVERNIGRKYVLIEVTNESTETYHWVMVCGTLRSGAGAIREVGRTPPLGNGFPFTSLLPGETRTKIIYFHSMPEGVLEFFPEGRIATGVRELRVPPENLDVVRTRTLVDAAGDPYLEVIGELSNPFDTPIQGLMASTYIEGSPELRDEDIEIGCGGAAGALETIPIKFSMPTKGTLAHSVPVIEAIGAVVNAVPQVEIEVTDLHVVEGTLIGRFHNATDTGLAIYGICVAVRRGERLIDVFTAKHGPFLAPNQTVEARVVPVTLPTYGDVSIEVIAFGAPASAPPRQ